MIRLAVPALFCLALIAPGGSALAEPQPGARAPAAFAPDLTEPWLLQMNTGKRKPGLSYPVVSRGTYLNPRQNAAAFGRPAQLPQKPTARTEQRRRLVDARYLPQEVAYSGGGAPGTIVIDTEKRFLYLVLDNGRAKRYGVGVGRPGFEWAGTHKITRTAEWPDWTPPSEMLERQPNLPRHMKGGPENPLGARALYLGSTLYRIHGSNEPWTIGHAVSSGCIRMRNEDVIDLYGRVKVGTKVVVI